MTAAVYEVLLQIQTESSTKYLPFAREVLALKSAPVHIIPLPIWYEE